MRLHLIATGLSFVAAPLVAASLLLASSARAEGTDQAKSIEMIPGQVTPRTAKLRAPQAQLCVEQKEAPAASKTSLRLESAPRLQSKSKD